MDHSGHGTHLLSVAAMAWSGFTLTALVPGVVGVTRDSPVWERMSLPPGLALPLLVLLHAWVMLGETTGLTPAVSPFLAEAVLLVAGVLFWVPVVARTRHRLGDTGRCLYLFLAAPLLDLPALGVIAAGHSAEGIAMIVGMLPLSLAAAVLTWTWVNREERLASTPGVPGGEGRV
ncbi:MULTISPECIES: hypothetical protein [unclassified Streptomyces]|uniref:hypothetical protein n=1 Tax=unclassified Streptomyces TaxID=2593676 RepID=UPI00244199C3|nr:hypothetical protein [Streptomyces sp. DH41]MDG9722796.1 hypothetical protein [Streptomyces sp. DH41]